MTPAIRALVWEMFARHRWILGGSGVYLLLLCLVVPLLPEQARFAELGAAVIAPIVLGLVCLVSNLSYGEDVRLDAELGGLPQRILLLPISAGVIAGVPLVLSLGLCVSLWSVVSVWILRPCGVDAPLIWPGLMVAVVFAWIAALCWVPLPLPWLRLALLSIFLLVFTLGGIILIGEIKPPEPVLILGLGPLWPAALVLAIVGVRRTRSGGVGSWWGNVNVVAAPSDSTLPLPYRSPMRGLFWLEWRMHGRPLVYLSVFYLSIMLPVVIMTEHVLRSAPAIFQVIANGTMLELGPAWTALCWFLFVPLMYALVGGGGAGIYSQTPPRVGLPLWVSVRPVLNEDLLRVKFLAAGLHLLIMWGMMLAVAIVWELVAGNMSEMAHGLTLVCGSPLIAALAVVGLAVAIYTVTYFFYIGSMWMGLFGSQFGAIIPPLVNVTGLCVAVCLAVSWKQAWLPWLQAGLWIGLGLKVMALAFMLWINKTRRLVRPSMVLVVLAAWAIVALPLAITLALLSAAPVTTALAVVVLLPLAQILAAPAALHRGRHGAWA